MYHLYLDTIIYMAREKEIVFMILLLLQEESMLLEGSISNVIKRAAHIIFCKYFGSISALVNTILIKKSTIYSSYFLCFHMIHCRGGPWMRAFRPLSHMRKNHCQINFYFAFKTFMEKVTQPIAS